VDGETERALVARLRCGEGRAFDVIFDHYRPKIFGFLARMAGRRELAEDLTQETFLRLARKATTLAEDTRLAAWLFTVARNLYYSHCRSASLDAERLDRLALRGPEPEPGPFEDAAASELGRRLERAFARLGDRDREVLLLIAVEQVEHAAAAEVLGLSAEALRQRLSRARKALEGLLSGHETVRRSS
jgi:RNA polymerase sigma-70 factor (ECF subfamily)